LLSAIGLETRGLRDIARPVTWMEPSFYAGIIDAAREKETNMPIILWLLGVPLVVVVLLMLAHVI
jgi:hypothetical protein